MSGAREGTLGGTGAVCRLRAQCFFLEKLLSLSVLHTSSAPCLWNGHMEPANGVSHAQLLVRPPVSTPRSGTDSWTPVCSSSRYKVAGQPGAGDAEHRQLPVAHGRPAGAGGHCQCVQGPEQGRAQPTPGPLTPRKFLAQSTPSGPQGGMWLGRGVWTLSCTLRGEGGYTVGLSRCAGSWKGLLGLMLLSGTVWDRRERQADSKPTARGEGSRSRTCRGGKQDVFGLQQPSLQNCMEPTSALLSLVLRTEARQKGSQPQVCW